MSRPLLRRGRAPRLRGPVQPRRPAGGPVARARAGAPGARVAMAADDDPPDPGLVLPAGSALVSRRARLRGTVYLLLDTSASMSDGDKMSQLLRGSVRFFYEAWRRRYAVGVIAFDRGARVMSGATRDPHRFQRSLAGLEPGGGTAMAAALRLALWRLRLRRGRRVALLITDGKPDSREDTLDAAARARALGVTVLAVGTDPADQAFLRALVPRPELAVRVARDDLAGGIGRSAGALPDD